MRVVDADVLLRYLLADHRRHYEQAAAFLAQVRQGEQQAYVTDAVVAECIYVLTGFYRVPLQEAADRLEKLLGYRGIRGPHVAALRHALRRYGRGGIDFVDALGLAIAREQGLAMESFDRKLLCERDED